MIFNGYLFHLLQEVVDGINNYASIDLRHRLKDSNPRYPNSSNPSTTLRSTTQITRKHSLFNPKKVCAEDRFILQRSRYNVEASNYLLTRKVTKTPKENELDVFEQMDSLSVKWRKKYMHQLMAKENIIPGLRQKEVLRGNHLSIENKLPGHLAGRPKVLWDEEYFEDGMWKSKPRKKPLIHLIDAILDMPGFQVAPSSRHHLIDWSSKDVIAAAIQDAITFYDSYAFQATQPLENIDVANVCTLKWSNAGDKLLICTLSSAMKLYSLETQKIIWTAKCKSVATLSSPCYVRCACWSHNDQHIVAGCTGLITVYLAKTGSVVHSVLAHTRGILALAFSSNYRYLVSSSKDMTVRIFLWPGLTLHLDITYFQPVKALAWHPYESGTLCLGGGLGDASLSLWNVNKLDPEQVSYRHVDFFGAVKNLAWNKISGELVVHWSYWIGENQYTAIPVLASLDRVVDVLPVEKDSQFNYIMWNSDHTQLTVQCNEFLSMWNFFGSEYYRHRKHKKQREVRKNTGVLNLEEFKHFTIR
ncbi:protein cortex [Calliopsis andreniformis]|uniref:protein cortex n=1 Tax=Calliopsis andreniformis TaxID=337506 RepID=UPI003FCD8068